MDYFDLNAPAGITSHVMEVAGVVGSRASYDTEYVIRLSVHSSLRFHFSFHSRQSNLSTVVCYSFATQRIEIIHIRISLVPTVTATRDWYIVDYISYNPTENMFDEFSSTSQFDFIV